MARWRGGCHVPEARPYGIVATKYNQLRVENLIVRFVAVALLMLAGAACVGEDEPRSVVEVGDRLPDFSVVMDDGSTVSTASLRDAPSMIVFFTTTCGDCRRELPRIDAYASAHPSVRVVCIARSEPAAEIEAFWQANGLSLPYSAQPDAAVYNLFATAGVPRVYCADAELRITAIYVEEFPL